MLAVIPEDGHQIGENDDTDKQRTREMEAAKARGRGQSRVQEHLVNDEPHEQRFEQLKARGQQRENKERADRVTMRPQPAQILPHMLTPPDAKRAFGFRRRCVLACLCRIVAPLLVVVGLFRVIQPPAFVVLNEATIAMA